MNRTPYPKSKTRNIFLLLILVFTISMQGCIEIVEELTLNENQSGSLSISLGMADGNNLILALLGQYADLSFFDDIRTNALVAQERLRTQEGISKVRFTGSPRQGSLQLSFDFSDDKALNEALYAMAGYEKPFWQGKIYKIKKHKLVRKNTTRWIKRLIEQEEANIPDEVLFDLITLKSVFNVPAKARNFSKPRHAIATNGDRTFTSVNNLSDLMDEKRNTRIKIRY